MGIREERLHRAAEMPHRSPAGDDRLDARLASEIGRLFFEKRITEPEYEAGIRYAQIVLDYLKSVDAPEPYGAELGPLTDDECFKRKLAFSAARSVLRKLGPVSRMYAGEPRENRCSVAVDRVTVYDEQCRSELEFEALRRGLHALAGLEWLGSELSRVLALAV